MITVEIITKVLGLGSPEDMAIKIGKTIVTDLLRHPRPESFGPANVLSRTRGRVRLAVADMKRSPWLATRIERRLASVPGVTKVNASPVTGTILVQFDASQVDERLLMKVVELSTAALRVVAAEPEYRLDLVQPAEA
jgi:copper chaperone CopZ